MAAIGYSAGAVSAILSAARNPQIGAVVAVAPYNCVDEVWQTGRPAVMPAFLQDLTLWLTEKRKGFDRARICPVEVVDQIAPRPLLVIHGTDDRRILESQVRAPVCRGQRAQEPVAGAGRNPQQHPHPGAGRADAAGRRLSG